MPLLRAVQCHAILLRNHLTLKYKMIVFLTPLKSISPPSSLTTFIILQPSECKEHFFPSTTNALCLKVLPGVNLCPSVVPPTSSISKVKKNVCIQRLDSTHPDFNRCIATAVGMHNKSEGKHTNWRSSHKLNYFD